MTNSDALTDAVTDTSGFNSLGLDPRLLAALMKLGYEEPTSVQTATIPPLLAGRDVLGQAATGTGKTAAFALPLLHLINPKAVASERTTGLVLCPTRELAMQVAEAIHKYGRDIGVTVLPIYGGAPMETQLRALKRGVDIVVATPGRALDHLRRKSLNLTSLKMVVLDEADEMLDMGFAEDIETILAETPKDRQTALFSATLPAKIQSIARKQLRDPLIVSIERTAAAEGETLKIRQVAYMVPKVHKMAALGRVLDVEQPTSAIVFCRTRTEVDQLTEAMGGHGLRAEALHGGLSQDQRERVMKRFRSKKTDLLVATDVAARGLDVKHVSHVFNYDVPSDTEAYVHRIGRTGRAGRTGIAITLLEPREQWMLRNIERATKNVIEIAKLPTVADMRAKRLEKTREQLRETVLGGELDDFRAVVGSLTEEFDISDIAAAAVKLLRGEDEAVGAVEIPDVSFDRRAPSSSPGRRTSSSPRGAMPSSRMGPGRETTGAPPPRTRSRQLTPEFIMARGGKPDAVGVSPRGKRGVARLWIAGGRNANIRPGDLVGAIANEANMDSALIGSIRVEDSYSTVEVPEKSVELIIRALSASKIKGKRVQVRRDLDGGGAPPMKRPVRR